MNKLKRILGVLFHQQENIFSGAYFLIFKRKYKATFGSFDVPHTWSRAHFYARFLNDGYESEERTLISKHLDKHDHVIELGACVGVVSCLTAEIIDNGRHCVVEANPHLLPFLYKNRAQNNKKFQIIGAALTEQKEVTFYLNRNMVGGSSQRETNDKCPIIGLSPSNINKRFGPFNTLIMDIEGGEQEFIEQHIPEQPDLEKLIIEFHPTILGKDTIIQLKKKLVALNFTCIESIGDVDFWKRTNS
ncbi:MULTISPECIES: FkbM family methyltransferase [unclassified Lentimonas]|uniref:FkbM family methyltransferase n=1 Tax=unclassified Lentimonas TaxID=2630993 RepID=UPI0013279F3A|nr:MULTISPECIES: FkbM family methyltransferase [unclassified Lentimonas]CAA6694167.1 Unannotated [Lentimonas sp. CC10]CAA6694334.1 Unannotated [Lentimonas sp. CC19]CAA7071090.1 Unannotated [Lentimonas sp. CC11]